MTVLLCVGGPHDGEWVKAPEGHGIVSVYDCAPRPGGVQVDQHVYERRRIGAGPGVATRDGAHEWTVLVHLGASEFELAAWLATQGGPLVEGPVPRNPDRPCNRCPDSMFASCFTGLCVMYPAQPAREKART